MSDRDLIGLHRDVVDKYDVPHNLYSTVEARLMSIRHRKADRATYKIAYKLIELEMIINGMG